MQGKDTLRSNLKKKKPAAKAPEHEKSRIVKTKHQLADPAPSEPPIATETGLVGKPKHQLADPAPREAPIMEWLSRNKLPATGLQVLQKHGVEVLMDVAEFNREDLQVIVEDLQMNLLTRRRFLTAAAALSAHTQESGHASFTGMAYQVRPKKKMGLSCYNTPFTWLGVPFLLI